MEDLRKSNFLKRNFPLILGIIVGIPTGFYITKGIDIAVSIEWVLTNMNIV